MRLTFMSSSGGTWGSRLSRELCSESTASAWSVFDFSCWESQLFHWIQLNQIHQIPTGSHMAHLCETVLWHFLSLYTCAYKPVFVVSFGFFGVFFLNFCPRDKNCNCYFSGPDKMFRIRGVNTWWLQKRVGLCITIFLQGIIFGVNEKLLFICKW